MGDMKLLATDVDKLLSFLQNNILETLLHVIVQYLFNCEILLYLICLNKHILASFFYYNVKKGENNATCNIM